MLVADEPNVDLLRKKARVLEHENGRLIVKVTELLRENSTLKGMDAHSFELNLPGLAERARKPSGLTRAGNERRPRKDDATDDDNEQKGHGPTEQPELEVIEQTFDLDEPDKVCTSCGGDLNEWVGREDVVDVVDRIPPKWIVRRERRKKYRCQCGGCVETADGTPKLIFGGRYALGVAIASAVDKFLDHLPTERQVRIARRFSVKLTSQTLWDQQAALSDLLSPLCARIKEYVLSQPVVGADQSPFKLIKKGGAIKHQVWQLSCPTARYFEILDSKRADAGEELFKIVDEEGNVIRTFSGTAVLDGAAELEKIARRVRFSIAACWSHARRNMLKAEGEAPGQVAEFLDLVGELYAIERRAARDPPSTPGGYRRTTDLDKLRQLRDVESRAVTVRLKEWLLAQRFIPGGNLDKAIRYVVARWTNLTRFLNDPHIPLDNNNTEGGYISLAIGRRNYVGSRSLRGTLVAARFYTVFETAKLAGADPAAYVEYAASEILAGREPLLPHDWV